MRIRNQRNRHFQIISVRRLSGSLFDNPPTVISALSLRAAAGPPPAHHHRNIGQPKLDGWCPTVNLLQCQLRRTIYVVHYFLSFFGITQTYFAWKLLNIQTHKVCVLVHSEHSQELDSKKQYHNEKAFVNLREEATTVLQKTVQYLLLAALKRN